MITFGIVSFTASCDEDEVVLGKIDTFHDNRQSETRQTFIEIFEAWIFGKSDKSSVFQLYECRGVRLDHFNISGGCEVGEGVGCGDGCVDFVLDDQICWCDFSFWGSI